MTVQRITKMSQVTVDFASGVVLLKMEKQIIDDDGSILFSEPHRTSVAAGGDLYLQMALVNSNLVQMKFDPIPLDEIAKLQDIFLVDWVDASRKAGALIEAKAQSNPFGQK